LVLNIKYDMLSKIEPKYPEIEADLSSAGGNAVAVMSQVRIALRAAKVPASEVSAFFDEALSQEFGPLIETCRRWVRVVGVDDEDVGELAA